MRKKILLSLLALSISTLLWLSLWSIAAVLLLVLQ